jgi:hypothetical protein
LTRKIAEQN